MKRKEMVELGIRKKKRKKNGFISKRGKKKTIECEEDGVLLMNCDQLFQNLQQILLRRERHYKRILKKSLLREREKKKT